MKLKYRRIIYIFCFLIFFTFTPIIVIYSMGYRYNFKKNKFERTGLLSIKTMQDDIHIYINKDLYTHKVKKYSFLPKTISSKIEYPSDLKIFLLPGEYEITLSKEGYYDWNGNISIQQNLTTFIQSVILFKKSIPLKLTAGKIKDIKFSNDKNIQFLKSENSTTTLMKINLTDFKEAKIYESLKKIEYIPSANNERILIKGEKDYSIIDPASTENKIVLKDILDKKLVNVKWDKKNDYKLYAIEEKSGILFEIDLISMKATPLNLLENQDYIMRDNNIFTLKTNNELQQTLLIRIAGNNAETIEKIPFSKDISFIENKLDYILIKDNKANILYVLDPLAKNVSKVKTSIYGINKFIINNARDKILYANDFEIWIYDLKEDKKDLITRLSSPIKNILWHKNENYIIFSTSTDINSIEISNFNNNNYTNFISIANVGEILLDEKGKNLYFTGNTSSQKGLFDLELY